MPSQVGDVALHVAATLGWHCISVEAGSKRPRHKAWQTEATTDPVKLRQWFSARSRANLGVRTGPGSNIWALDVDPHNGGDEGLAQLIAELGPLPPTLVQDTARGGQHYIFKWPIAGGIRNRAHIAPGIDVRGEAGFIVVAPSVLSHPETGEILGEWKWRNWGTPIAAAHEALVTYVIAHGRRTTPEHAPQPERPEGLGRGRGEAWAEAALESICQEIASAPVGRQEVTLNGNSMRIGQIVAGGYLPGPYALQRLIAAGMMMANGDDHDRWTLRVVSAKVERAMRDGVAKGAVHPPHREKPSFTTIEGGQSRKRQHQRQGGAQAQPEPDAEPDPEADPEAQPDPADRSWMGPFSDWVWIKGPKLKPDSARNHQLACERHPALKGRAAHDAWANRPLLMGLLPEGLDEACPRTFVDVDWTLLAQWFPTIGLAPSDQAVKRAFFAEARRSSLINPLCDTLDGFAQAFEAASPEPVEDATTLTEAWLITHLGAAPTAYHRLVGRKTLISAVARAYQPGCQVDFVMILEGLVQGEGKTTVIGVLANGKAGANMTGPFNRFTNQLPARLSGKEPSIAILGKWLVEIGEIDRFTSDPDKASELKDFVTRRVDHYRPVWGGAAEDFFRGCIFIGTTNEEAYLSDATGARRFLPVRCGKISYPSDEERAQLLGAAVTLYRRGVKWWPETPQEIELFAAEADDRFDQDAWEPAINEWLASPNAQGQGGQGRFVTSADILKEALQIWLPKDQNKAAKDKVGSIMRHLGYLSRVRTVHGSRVRGFVINQTAPAQEEMDT